MKQSRSRCAVVAGFLLLTTGSAMADDRNTQLGEVVVTATRDELPVEQVGSSITVITAKEIEQQKKRDVAELLRMVPGLDLIRTGSYGITSVSTRGAKAEHTLVLIDGVEMNDPSTTGGGFDFANLTTDNIERIEVLRGPQSTLYGSSAIGGVINIITKRGDGDMKGYLSAYGGSLYTAGESAGISGSKGIFNYSLALSRLDTNGISAAASRYYTNTEKDGYQNSTVATKIGITPGSNSDIDLSIRYSHARTPIDNGGGLGADDPRRITKADEFYMRAQGWLSLFDGFWEQKLGVSFSDITRYDDADPDTQNSNSTLRSVFHGQTTKVDWQNNLKLHKTNTLVLGVERKEENANSNYDSLSQWGPYSSNWPESHASNTGVYLEDQVNLWDAWFSTLGVRVDEHSKFGTEATYRFTTAYLVKQTGTKIKGTYGTGFKAPSLYQLYSEYGSPNLQPDKSIGWDAGIEQEIALLKTKLGATWFRNEYTQMIDFDSQTWKYTNIARAHTQGLELTLSVKPVDELTLKASYTYLETRDDITGKELLRRPKNKASFDVNYSFLKKVNLNLGFVYVGPRYDEDYSTYPGPTIVKMKDYLLVNLAASYDVTKNLQLFGRIDNLFDRRYEEVLGYGTPGIGAYGGVKVSF